MFSVSRHCNQFSSKTFSKLDFSTLQCRNFSFPSNSSPKFPGKILVESTLSKSFVDSLTDATPKNIFRSSFTQPHSFSRPYHGVSGVLSGPLGSSILVRQIMSSGHHLKKQSRGVFDNVLSMRTPFAKRHFRVPRVYTSRRSNWRSWLPNVDNLIFGIVVANVGVFILWRTVDRAFMMKHFTISVESFTSGRVHTLITSAFSHIRQEHIFSNMLGLYFFGTRIGRVFGPEFLLKLYIAGALGGSICYILHHASMSPSSKGSGSWYVDPKKIPGLGASGAVNAIMLLDIFLFPTATIYYNFFIPIPAILVGALLIGKDLWRMKDNKSHISGSAHMGGALVAALAWARIRKRWI